MKGVCIMLLLTVERKARKLSQAEIARRAGMHVSSISGIEARRLMPWSGQITRITETMRDAGWDGNGDLFSEVSDDGAA
jgi:transcriptional regulator with XRE-family HTH domain